MVNPHEVEIDGRKLVVYDHDDLSEPGTGRAYTGSWAWRSSFVLGQWMGSRTSLSLKGKRAVELGAGTGVPGLVAAAMGADVVLTDIQALIPGLQRNIDENGLGEKAKAMALVWGDGCSGIDPPVDFILMSDVWYDVESMPDLCKTLRELSDGDTKILMACELRLVASECLEIMAEEGFVLSEVPQSELHSQWQDQDFAVFIATLGEKKKKDI
jgi:nicotinamide N-methyltransferase